MITHCETRHPALSALTLISSAPWFRRRLNQAPMLIRLISLCRFYVTKAQQPQVLTREYSA